MSFHWGSRSKQRMKGVNNDLIICANRALIKSKYDMTIPWMGGVRTPEEQNAIFKEGNSKCDGFKIKSYHQSGNALDIIPVVKGYKNTRAMNHFANHMLIEWQKMIDESDTTWKSQGLYMTWGGTFGAQGWDKPHYQVS